MNSTSGSLYTKDYGNEEKHKPPVKKYSCGPVTAAIWEKEISIKDKQTGEMRLIKIHTVSVQRKYKDKEGNWKNSPNLPLDNIEDARIALAKCYEWAKLKDVTDSSESFETSNNV